MNGAPRRYYRRLALRLAVGTVALYALLAIAGCRHLADGFIFHPEYAGRTAAPGGFYLPMKDGAPVEAVHLRNDTASWTLWYFHGNAESLADVLPRLLELRARGWNVFAVDYPGYGTSGGTPSEQSIYAAAFVGKTYLTTQAHVPLERVVVYGRSLGGGPAVEIAANEPAAGLILESAFTSIYRVALGRPWLPGDQFTNLEKMSGVKSPVLVIHGRDDRIVPFAQGEALYAAAAEPKHHLWVDAAGHNDMQAVAGERYWRALEEFRAGLTPDS